MFRALPSWAGMPVRATRVAKILFKPAKSRVAGPDPVGAPGAVKLRRGRTYAMTLSSVTIDPVASRVGMSGTDRRELLKQLHVITTNNI